MNENKQPLLDLDTPMEEYTAMLLLLLDAVKIKKLGEEPFTYTSGNKGPIYIDCRVLISHPAQMNILSGFLKTLIDTYILEERIDFIAGGATAGMPFAQKVAELLGVPYFYIRKADKKYGIKDRIVGDQSLLRGNGILIEDLMTNGASKIDFVNALRAVGVECNFCFVVFNREQGGDERLRANGVYNYDIVRLRRTLGIAVNKGIIDLPTFDMLQEYLNDPKKWAEVRGYEFYE